MKSGSKVKRNGTRDLLTSYYQTAFSNCLQTKLRFFFCVSPIDLTLIQHGKTAFCVTTSSEVCSAETEIDWSLTALQRSVD